MLVITFGSCYKKHGTISEHQEMIGSDHHSHYGIR